MSLACKSLYSDAGFNCTGIVASLYFLSILLFAGEKCKSDCRVKLTSGTNVAGHGLKVLLKAITLNTSNNISDAHLRNTNNNLNMMYRYR